VSRLDSFIRRLEAQRACLGFAARLIEPIPGAVLELGLGNGRTYDHLRELCPQRPVYVCERQVAAHPDCVPPAEMLLLGDMRDTLRAAGASFAGRIALAHFDAAAGDPAAGKAFAAKIAALVLPLLCPGAVLVSEPPMAAELLDPLALPDGIAAGRYHLYRRRR
jgi:S-adenosylmethionine-dependent methyltransferase